jgi:6-phosphogluconolactonase
VAHAAANRLVTAASRAIEASGRFTIALSGGSTPRALYTLLASPAYQDRIDWPRVHVAFGDERCVPPDDPASNYRMARQALLDDVPIPPAQVHRLRGEDPPEVAADAYEQELRALFATPEGPPRDATGARFDLVLLGMGDNGHTASLFPHRPVVREARRWVVADFVAEVSMWRLTLTTIPINAAYEVLFLVAGADKAAMLARVLEGPYDPDALPAQGIVPRGGRLSWIVDVAAAAELARSRTA